MSPRLLALLLLLIVGCDRDIPVDPNKPLLHEAPVPDAPSATEYFLPHPAMPDDVRDRLPAWMHQIAESEISAVEQAVRERFAHVTQPELRLLCDQLQSYKPVSIVVQEDMQCWLRLDSGLERENVGSSAFLPPEPEAKIIEAKLAKTDFDSNSLFGAFMHQFSGLAEDFSSAGNFVESSVEWQTLSEEWQDEIIQNYDEWYGSLLFYHARNGDQLLLHTNGKVGWWKYAEGRITHEFDSFSEFLSFYVDYRANTSWPLDSYGPPAPEE